MAKLLLIDDDKQLAFALKEWFTSAGHTFEHADTGEDGLQMLNNFEFDLILLDWMLPGIKGIDVCKSFRSSGGKTHIIFLTGEGDISNVETGLESGADDYIVKPFNIRELNARVRTVLRRPTSLLTNELRIDDLVLDTQKRIVRIGDQEITLTQKESALLEFLMRNPNRMCDSHTLVDAVWPSDSNGSVEAVRTWMKNLRQKLAAAGKTDLIKTVRGSGYMIEFHEPRT